MPLEESVTKYQKDVFSQADMLKDHSERVLKTALDKKKEYQEHASMAALELGMNAIQTYKIINDVKKGVCAALCIKWIKLIAKDEKYPPMLRLRQDVTFAKAVIRQNNAKSPGLQQEKLAASYGLKTATKKELNFSRSLAPMVVDILSEVGVYYLMSFRTETGSHVIAIGSQDCKSVIVFDPNFGEFTVPRSKLTTFLTDLLQQGYSVEPNNINGLSKWTI